MRVFCVSFLVVALAQLEGNTVFGANLGVCPPKGELVARCNGHLVDLSNADGDNRAQFFSPGFYSHKKQYPPNARCKYEFSVPAGKRLVLDIDSFNVTVDGFYNYTTWSCGGDGLVFYINGVASVPHCGVTQDKILVLEPRNYDWNLTAVFRSNGSIEARGFNMFLNVADKVTKPPVKQPPPDRPFQCGVMNTDRQQYIVGGNEVKPHSIPWQVGLLFKILPTIGPICGGTLISPSHVLTAAHCTIEYSADFFVVVVAEHNVTTSSVDDGIVHNVKCKQEHPRYVKWLTNDFAMLILETKVNIGPSSFARVACLPFDVKEDYLGETLTVSGWGDLGFGEKGPDVLNAVDEPVLSNSYCSLIYGLTKDQYFFMQPNMMCTGLEEGGTGACHGDSGGPLTYTGNGVTAVVGVVSWGLGCGWEGRPSVYARVTEAMPWIQGFNITDSSDVMCPS